MGLVKSSKLLEEELMKYGPLFGDFETVPWLISPDWFEITKSQLEELQSIGSVLRKFLMTCDNLYYEDEDARNIVEQNKSDKTLHFQRRQMRGELPILVRPDMVITNDGFKIVELEVLVGGIGEVPAVKEAYLSIVPPSRPYNGSMVNSFVRAMEQIPGDGRMDRTLLVTSFPTRFPELKIFSKLCRDRGYETLPMRLEDIYGIDDDCAKLIWRLFDVDDIEELKHIPNIPISPPLKQFLQEKAWLGILHDPGYEDYWESNLGQDFHLLKNSTAKTWILRKGYMPPTDELKNLPKSKRRYVTKLSDSWGSRSFTYWPEKSGRQWNRFLSDVPEGNSLYIMQEYQDSLKFSFPAYVNGKISYLENLRALITPYYFFVGEKAELADIQVTLRKSRKVHGATDSIIVPVSIK
ncbi:MAG: hypothetical protein HYS53_00520 [Candidatus Aenigmarchaeota archaeon]|nr:hypothetical protein [Candidatus Aenigmarchaeota archaeon]